VSELSQVLALKKHLTEIGTLLGVDSDLYDTPDEYARRVKERALSLKAAAGITWPDYVCVRGAATFAPRERRGISWSVGEGQTLEDLAAKIGTYEHLTT
jgi:hypothetical protein